MSYQGLVALANRLKAPLLVFDLEATALRGRANFGITEFAGLLVYPQGKCVWVSSLVNPENAISPEVVQITGITQNMVDGEQPWGTRLAGLLDYWAANAVVVGFNSKAFDCPAVVEQNARYGILNTRFTRTLDVKSLANSIWGISGKLVDVAREFGQEADGQLHRAAADVSLTARTLDVMAQQALDRVASMVAPLEWTDTVKQGVTGQVRAILWELSKQGKVWSESVEGVGPATDVAVEAPAAKPEPSPRAKPAAAPKPKAEKGESAASRRQTAILVCLTEHPDVDSLKALREKLAGHPDFPADKVSNTVDWAVAELIDAGQVPAARFVTPDILQWFASKLPALEAFWEQEQRKLKPLLERLQQEGFRPMELDYVILRAGLEHVGWDWPSKTAKTATAEA